MYAILGATGNTGSVVVNELLKQGKEVRAIGRTLDKLKSFGDKGAEPFAGSAENAAELTAAFTGCDVVYALIPPKMTANFRDYQGKISDAIAAAVRTAGVKSAIILSSLGAELPSGTGVVLGLYDFEQKMNQLDGVNVLSLRPPFFMENSLSSIGLIKMMGINGGAVKADLPIPMVVAHDVGVYAAKRLLALDFQGKQVAEIQGNREITWTEATKVIGAAIGMPDLQYIQFSYEDAVNGMASMGLPRDFAESYAELSRAANDGLLKYGTPRNAENTTPTTFEEFVKTRFALAFLNS